jgi:hypothetical protein
VDCGLWTVDCGLWTVDCGLWTVDCGLWTVDCGLWTVDCGLWTVDSIFKQTHSKMSRILTTWYCSTLYNVPDHLEVP